MSRRSSTSTVISAHEPELTQLPSLQAVSSCPVTITREDNGLTTSSGIVHPRNYPSGAEHIDGCTITEGFGASNPTPGSSPPAPEAISLLCSEVLGENFTTSSIR